MTLQNHTLQTSWWFQPLLNIYSSNWIISPGFRGEKKQIFDSPTPSGFYCSLFFVENHLQQPPSPGSHRSTHQSTNTPSPVFGSAVARRRGIPCRSCAQVSTAPGEELTKRGSFGTSVFSIRAPSPLFNPPWWNPVLKGDGDPNEYPI